MQDVLSELIAARLCGDHAIMAYMQEQQVPLKEAVRQVMSDQSRSLVMEQYKDIVSGKYNCNWSDAGCAMYFARPPPGRPEILCHTHCGADVSAASGSPDVCVTCLLEPEGRKLADKLASGLTREMYRAQKERLRLTIAMGKLRLLDERPLKLSANRKPIWGFAYDHDSRYGYHAPTGLVFHPRVVRGIKGNYTVGIDDSNSGVVRKITLTDLEKIGDFDVIRVVESLEERAARYVTRNIAR